MTLHLILSLVQNSFPDFSIPSEAFNGFQVAPTVKTITDTQTSDKESVKTFHKNPFAQNMFWKDSLSGPTTLLCALRDYIVQRIFEFKRHYNFDNLIWGVPRCFFEGDADDQYGLIQHQQSRSTSHTQESKTSKYAPITFNKSSCSYAKEGSERKWLTIFHDDSEWQSVYRWDRRKCSRLFQQLLKYFSRIRPHQ